MSVTTNFATTPSLFMVVATMRAGIDVADLAALRAAEQERLRLLQSDGKIGAHHVSAARRTVFLEVKSVDQEGVAEVLATLPFNRFFDVDVYPVTIPDAADGAVQTGS